MRWLRRFAMAAAASALLAALLSLVVEPSLAMVVGIAGAATGAVLAFGRRIDGAGAATAAGDAERPGEPPAGSGAGKPPAPS